MNFLYNGVKLPALPEWDKEKYPYAAMNLGANYGVLYLLDNALMAKQFQWANFDILNEDGTLYLAASDPVPVTPSRLTRRR